MGWIPIDQVPEISGSCWKIMAALGTVIVGMAAYIVTLHKMYGRKINEVYDARIADFKESNSLVETLIRVLGKEKGGR